MIYDDKKFIGDVIKKARKVANLKQSVLAEKIGMTDKNLGNIENGKQYPQLNNFFRLLEVLNLSVNDFGVKTRASQNDIREKLLHEIYVSSEKELQIYLEILNSLKKLVERWNWKYIEIRQIVVFVI